MANKKQVKNIQTKKHFAREQREARQTRVILIISGVVGIIILGLIAYGLISQTIIRPRTPVARVGDNVITVRDFERNVQYSRLQMLNQSYQYYTFYQQFGDFGGSFLQSAQSMVMELMDPVSFGSSVLDEMVDEQIIREEAAIRNITVSQEEIDQAIQAAFGFFPDGTPTPTVTATIQPTPTYSETQLALITLTSTPTEVSSDGESLEEVTPADPDEGEETDSVEAEQPLADTDQTDVAVEGEQLEPEGDLPTPEVTPTITLTPTPYTTALFAQNIREFNNLYSLYKFDIDNLRELFETQILREKLTEVITQDLSPIRDEVWARHILVETYEEALEVLSLLEEGEDFHTLAETYSTDESNREQGGDLGWFDENSMVAPFSEVAFQLNEGEISEPVETDFGFHIIQSLGKRQNQIPPAEFAQQKQSEFSQWLIETRNSRDDIIIYEEWEKFVPVTPEVPQQYLVELYQQPQQ